MKKSRRTRGGSLRSWIQKGLQLAKTHGIPLIKNHKLISRGLEKLGTSGYLGKYSPIAQHASAFAKQYGYGRCCSGGALRSPGGALRSSGGALRSSGGRCRRR